MCFIFLTTSSSFFFFLNYSEGGILVSIENPDEQQFILQTVEVFKDSQSSFWIGLYKTHKGLFIVFSPLWNSRKKNVYVSSVHLKKKRNMMTFTLFALHLEETLLLIWINQKWFILLTHPSSKVL